MEESFPMEGGDGPYSYMKNSNLQRKAADEATVMLVSGIVENLGIEHSNATSYSIVDLGCSTGPNTFIAVNNIIETISEKFKINGCNKLPEFHVFFNDHVKNDFSILFTNLPPNRKYFAAGVPGSFYGRLFPKASLSFAYSANALHWLSKAPPELGDLNSAVCNRGRIFYANSPNEVGKAYAMQHMKDMRLFLHARAEELIPGGLVALLVSARPEGTTPSQFSLDAFFSPLESCLLDMVAEGIISEEKLDMFNIPVYSPSVVELRSIVLENGNFTIAKLEQVASANVSMNVPTPAEIRAGLESVLKKHFGSGHIDELFVRYGKKIVGWPQISLNNGNFSKLLFVLLKRN